MLLITLFVIVETEMNHLTSVIYNEPLDIGWFLSIPVADSRTHLWTIKHLYSTVWWVSSGSLSANSYDFLPEHFAPIWSLHGYRAIRDTTALTFALLGSMCTDEVCLHGGLIWIKIQALCIQSKMGNVWLGQTQPALLVLYIYFPQQVTYALRCGPLYTAEY